MEALEGGRDNAIYRKGNLVSRPASHWTMTVHQLLQHLHQHGFTACPKAVSIEGGKELLTFVEGDSYNYPLEVIDCFAHCVEICRKSAPLLS